MTILKVNTHVQHNGEQFPIGKVFEAEQSEFQHLINSGAFSVVEGAANVEDGQVIADQQATEAAKPAPEEEVKQAQDTWGPTKEPVVPAQDATDGDKTPTDGEQATTETTTANSPIVGGSDAKLTGEEL